MKVFIGQRREWWRVQAKEWEKERRNRKREDAADRNNKNRQTHTYSTSARVSGAGACKKRRKLRATFSSFIKLKTKVKLRENWWKVSTLPVFHGSLPILLTSASFQLDFFLRCVSLRLHSFVVVGCYDFRHDNDHGNDNVCRVQLFVLSPTKVHNNIITI